MPLLALLAAGLLHPAAHPQAFVCAKALTCERKGAGYVDHALVLVKDGHIEQVLPAQGAAIPAGYELVDLGARWVMPGMIDLHSHLGGSGGDINDMVLQVNAGLRVSPAVVPRKS